jgi:hypothetical protein
MNSFSTTSLKAAGFTGFESISHLRDTGLSEVPETQGVYIVLRSQSKQARFLRRSTAGHFKGRDPIVKVAVLRERWVDRASVIYIGKAGGKSNSATLHSRLRAYLDSGAGKKVGHWGGRLIWQLADVDSCRICWRTMTGEPRVYERQLIEAFVEHYGQRPFANLSG